MSRLEEKIAKLNTPEAEAHMKRLYGPEQKTLAAQKARYSDLLHKFEATFRNAERAVFFSAPGRTEIGGNHTDHNNGRVLAASVFCSGP